MDIDLTNKTDVQIENLIANHERLDARAKPLYPRLLEERARRTKMKTGLDHTKSIALLRDAAIRQECVSYGQLAAASGVPWSIARHQMNGANGHLDRLLDLCCHSLKLPMLPALCVNQKNLATGELDPTALSGFAEGARRLGYVVSDQRAFHKAHQKNCWDWDRTQQ